MIRHVAGVVFFVALATCQEAHWKKDMMMMNGTHPMELLERYRNASQARAADTNRDNRIDSNEFRQALYAQADDNRDGSVDQAEFMNNYRRRLPFLPSEVLVVMFDLLDDLNPDPNVPIPANYTPECNQQVNIFSNVADFGDGVLGQQDVSIQVFTQSNNPSVEDFQKALNIWVEAAAKRVHMFKSRPFIVGKHYDVEYDYDLFFSHVDANNDDIITTGELAAEMKKFSPSERVSRSDWVSRNVETYGQNRFVAMVIFDYLDDNNDLTLTADDVRKIIMWADANHDDRTTKQEMFRFLQRKDKTVRRMLGLPIKPFVYDCPDPTWNDGDDCEAVVDATLLTMDADYNFDGNVTVHEMKQHLSLMDHNMDGKVDRVEYLKFSARYSMDMSTADLEFDAIDMDGDGYFTWDDYENHFKKDEMTWMCACEYRLSTLASARAARHLAKERQMKMDLTRMKYFVMMNEALKNMETDHQRMHGGMTAWQWKTMNGRPAMGGCTACKPRDNWGMTGDKKDNDSMTDEEHRMMQMMMEMMKRMDMMSMMSHWGQHDATWRMMHLLMHAMQMLQQQAKRDNQGMSGGGNEMAQWMTWKMNTMKMDNQVWGMGQGQGHDGSWRVMGQMEGGQKKEGMSWPAWMGWQPEGQKKEEEEEEKGAFDKFMDWYAAEQKKKKDEEEEEKKKKQDGQNQWPQWQNWQGWQGWQGWHPKSGQATQEKKDEEKEKESEWEKFMAWHAEQQKKQKEQERQQGGGERSWPTWGGWQTGGEEKKKESQNTWPRWMEWGA